MRFHHTFRKIQVYFSSCCLTGGWDQRTGLTKRKALSSPLLEHFQINNVHRCPPKLARDAGNLRVFERTRPHLWEGHPHFWVDANHFPWEDSFHFWECPSESGTVFQEDIDLCVWGTSHTTWEDPAPNFPCEQVFVCIWPKKNATLNCENRTCELIWNRQGEFLLSVVLRCAGLLHDACCQFLSRQRICFSVVRSTNCQIGAN